MITYTVNASADQTGFHVKIAGNEGNRQTILGFYTEGAANAWIADDKRRTDSSMEPYQFHRAIRIAFTANRGQLLGGCALIRNHVWHVTSACGGCPNATTGLRRASNLRNRR